MNAAQKIEKAMERVEEASAALLQAAYNYGRNERDTWGDVSDQRELKRLARRYATAMRALRLSGAQA